MNESRLKNSVLLRMSIVAALSLLLLIPTFFVESVIDERQRRRDSAMSEIGQSWGGSQTLLGPVLTIPFKEYTTDAKGNVTSSDWNAHFLPSRLVIRTALKPAIRYRGIYEVALYNGQFLIEGEFPATQFNNLGVVPQNIRWKDAFVTFGVSDLKGVRDTVSLTWNGVPYPTLPGTLSEDVVSSGITFRPSITASSSFSFSLTINLNGSTEISFVPVGEITQVFLESSWGDPSFFGGFLPVNREISADKFKAEWKVLNLNRNFPQSWVGDRYKPLQSSFGARLFLPVDQYQKTSRTVKYALLFIALTFASLFLSEIMAKTVLHPIQYTLIGFALVLFYLLLISVSEHIGFNIAYIVSGTLVIGLVSLYTSWITATKRIAVVVFCVLTLLYTFLYVTLQLQDYALLIGTLGLLVTLFAIMYVTRRINWFSLDTLSRDR